MSSEDTTSYRTPTGLIIKTITTHAFALVSYAYVCSLLRRPTRNNLQAARILFFAFVPTLPLVELFISAFRALVQFLRNYEDEDDTNVWYYLSGALGMHATLSRSEDAPDKDRSHNVPLLHVDSKLLERTKSKVDWAWFGKMMAALFALTQAVGTIVMYGRRLDHGASECFGFDHRNGAMGIASTICGVISIIVLLMRFNWTVSQSFQAPVSPPYGSSKSQFAAKAVLSLVIHLAIATIANEDNRMLYTSVGSVSWLFLGDLRRHYGTRIWSGWQSVLLVVFLYVFRKDVGNKLGLDSSRWQRFIASRRWKRLKILVALCLTLWILVDIIWLFVVDIIQVVEEHGYYYSSDGGYWWQDPISDQIVVI